MRNPIDCAEANFECNLGEPKAYFEIDGMCVSYVVYAASCSSKNALNDWLIDSVFKSLLYQGGKYLYWREPEKVEFRNSTSEDPIYRIYTRIAVLDKDLNIIKVPDMMKPEGAKMRKLDDSDETEREVSE